jgi:hypothetical protein
MLNRGALCLLLIALAVLASPGLARPVDAQTIITVDDDNQNCVDGGSPDWSNITSALMLANPGDTIRICEGDYAAPSIDITTDYLTITGPAATPENDGVAIVHHSGYHSGWTSPIFRIYGDGVVVEGLDLNAVPPPGFTDPTIAIESQSNSLTIQHNEIRNATAQAVYASGRYVQVLSNNIHDNQEGIHCQCADSALSGNTVNGTGNSALAVYGNGSVITDNVVTNGSVEAYGDDALISSNRISGATVGALIHVEGNFIGVTDNTLSDSTGYGIMAASGNCTSTSVTIGRNTFSHVTAPIHLYDQNAADDLTLTATIGGGASEANTFTNSGGSLGDSSYLVQMDGATFDVNAQYNNWGLCTAADIEKEIHDKADDPAQGRVDFEPFIAPSGCSTPTPTATPTPTPTATPGGAATPIPGPTRTVTIAPGSWANFTWSGASSPQTVADCFGAGNVTVMYRLDAASGTFHRWIRGRDDLSNMGEVMRFDALLALNASAQSATCTMPDDVSPYTLTIPAASWANFAWLAFSFPAEVAPDACSEGSIAVIYRLDALTQTFQRWVRGRPDLSNMTDVQPYDALLALNASDQPSTCMFSHYGQLVTGSS